MSVRFGFVPVVPRLVGAHQEASVVAPYVPRLEALGGERWSGEDLSAPVPVIYLMATGGTERVLLDLRERRAAHVPGESVLLVAHPGNNSLPAALEVLARLQQDGVGGRVCYLRGPDDVDGYDAIAAAVRTQADVRLTSGSVHDLLTAPLGNHIVLVRGHHERALRSYWELAVAPLAR